MIRTAIYIHLLMHPYASLLCYKCQKWNPSRYDHLFESWCYSCVAATRTARSPSAAAAAAAL